MWKQIALIAVLLAGPLAAQTPPTVPDNFNVSRPTRPPGTRGYRGGGHGRHYVYPGSVVEVNRSEIKVQPGEGGDPIRFLIDKDTVIPSDLKPGARVSIEYGGTLDNKVYKAVAIKDLGPKKKFPKAKGPLTP